MAESDMEPGLSKLKARLQQQIDQVRNTKRGINALYEAFDEKPPYPDVDQELNGGNEHPARTILRPAIGNLLFAQFLRCGERHNSTPPASTRYTRR